MANLGEYTSGISKAQKIEIGQLYCQQKKFRYVALRKYIYLSRAFVNCKVISDAIKHNLNLLLFIAINSNASFITIKFLCIKAAIRDDQSKSFAGV